MSILKKEVGEIGKLVKVELPRLINGTLSLGKLENISEVQDEDICEKDEVLVTVKASNSDNRFSFIVDKEKAEYLLNTSIGAFIAVCEANGLSIRREFQELYPALFC